MLTKREIGQKFIIGFDGFDFTSDLEKLYNEYPFGGVILFKRNYKDLDQLNELTRKLKSLSADIPLFISVDQEGGIVQRFKESFTIIPSQNETGKYYEKTSDLKKIENLYNQVARELLKSGINLNFAPVIDVNTNPNNPIIGTRAFSDKVDIVSSLGSVVIKIFQDLNLIACAKHYPGHGDTEFDSHKTLPVLNHDLRRLLSLELVPFIEAIKSGVKTIMVAHLKFPKIDPDYPTSLSKIFICDILRKKLNFKDVVISDDFEMDAIKKNYSTEEFTRLSIEADIDAISICKNHEVYIKSFETILLNQKNLQEKINKQVNRIMKIKKKLGG
jgi:beta-N-acetylhexosaminidase